MPKSARNLKPIRAQFGAVENRKYSRQIFRPTEDSQQEQGIRIFDGCLPDEAPAIRKQPFLLRPGGGEKRFTAHTRIFARQRRIEKLLTGGKSALSANSPRGLSNLGVLVLEQLFQTGLFRLSVGMNCQHFKSGRSQWLGRRGRRLAQIFREKLYR